MDTNGYSVLQLKGVYLSTLEQLREASGYEAIMPRERASRIKAMLIDKIIDVKNELHAMGVTDDELDYIAGN